jgi:hypothetical protein
MLKTFEGSCFLRQIVKKVPVFFDFGQDLLCVCD